MGLIYVHRKIPVHFFEKQFEDTDSALILLCSQHAGAVPENTEGFYIAGNVPGI